jgi:hypothetical protein
MRQEIENSVRLSCEIGTLPARETWDMTTPPKTDMGIDGTPLTAEEAMALHSKLTAEEAMALHSKLTALLDDAFISFQEVDFLELNPNYSNWVTPRAVYGIPVSWLRTMSNLPGLSKKKMQNTVLANLGCARRPYALAFRVEGRVLDMSTFSNFLDHAALLRVELSQRGRSDLVYRVNSYAASGRHEPEGYWTNSKRAGRGILWLTEELTDEFLGISDQAGTYRKHPDKPETWRNFLRMAGFDAVLDNTAFLTSDFPQQIAVLDDSAIRLLEMFPNPCASRAQEPCPLGGKMGASRPV